MKKLALLLLLCGAAFAQGTFSTNIEPVLMKHQAQFMVSATGAYSFSQDTAALLHWRSDKAMFGGLTHDFAQFSSCCTLMGDFQLGAQYNGPHVKGALLWGAGVRTDISDSVTVTYGLHVDKVADARLFPSAYVSLDLHFGRKY